jgi:hypothetical protein
MTVYMACVVGDCTGCHKKHRALVFFYKAGFPSQRTECENSDFTSICVFKFVAEYNWLTEVCGMCSSVITAAHPL